MNTLAGLLMVALGVIGIRHDNEVIAVGGLFFTLAGAVLVIAYAIVPLSAIIK